jgi:Aminoglycoside N3''-acetyltransferase
MSLHMQDLIDGIKGMGIIPGDTILVHSSLKSFGYVEGGVQTVIGALLKSVGEEGTIIVPTFTGKRSDSKEVPPVFDVRYTPCRTGKIPETFRNMEGAKRSLHPTHSVAAIGAKRDYIIEGHENLLTPCSEGSPFHKNALLGGYIMLIGVDQERNSTVHSCEEIANVPYHLHKEITDIFITSYNGEKVLVRTKLHNWEKPLTNFNKFEEPFLERGIMKIGKIGGSTIRLIKADGMYEVALDLLRKNPLYLLA